ncbi:nicotinate-nucleotide adenylyltransferase [Aquibacillus sp. 3ASR75-11]|uniref:Probable nicotinate-nucleotide adenylyltransferase n=1 Tax=Terrihalobacillus insolitus TaxID=2950438 RepID=A0A9X4ANV4_9BACI|nr:nicotinate-nucleotide adenylyltransferase [Terrihalobacillus insolitus]MDC3413317.1 nicotinate-nucleotide adenylyltransferase [Terrihalobacillus insolitus]MDC3424900.1 nicotinate-nucleotide adenylyltransferase [Terrihalobacillus insolitus]
MKKIGILGGTFDPPHLGHLIMAEEVHFKLELDEVWFVPSYEPPHKEKAKTRVEDRIKMLEAAIQTNEHFSVNLLEIERSGKSYTYDTVRQLKKDNQNVTFYFIIGADMVEYLPNWYKVEELVRFIQFVGVKRKGFPLTSKYPILEVEAPLIDVSSTMIRERIANNQPVRYFVPDIVQKIIKERHLYGFE